MRTLVCLGVGLSSACTGGPTAELSAGETAGIERGRSPVNFVLTETWEPESFDVIDCRGGSILPATRAEDNDGLSVPDTLVFLGPDVYGVRIQNCTMSATFPIVALGGGYHHIHHNELNGTSRGVLVLGSDHNLVDHNVINSPFRDVNILGDSDGTLVWRNELNFAPGTPAFEGSPGLAYPTDTNGVGVGTFTYPGVNNAIVNGALYQDVSEYDTHPDGTTVVDNTVHMEGGELGIIFATRSRYGTAYGNTVHGGGIGLAVFGYPDDAPFYVPGTCSGDPSKRCDDWDPFTSCAVPGTEPKGTCEGVQEVLGGGRVVAPTFVGNSVDGAFIGATAGFSDGYRLERNDLANGDVGVELWNYALEDGTIRGNVTSGYNLGLRLNPDLGSIETAGADVSYNDFGANDWPFFALFLVWGPPPDFELSFAPYTLETSLPNNWWGSEPCGLPADSFWYPNTDGPDAFAEPVALAWRSGSADGIARCD